MKINQLYEIYSRTKCGKRIEAKQKHFVQYVERNCDIHPLEHK